DLFLDQPLLLRRDDTNPLDSPALTDRYTRYSSCAVSDRSLLCSGRHFEERFLDMAEDLAQSSTETEVTASPAKTTRKQRIAKAGATSKKRSGPALMYSNNSGAEVEPERFVAVRSVPMTRRCRSFQRAQPAICEKHGICA